MAKNNNQKGQPKQQPKQGQKITLNESTRDSVKAGGSQRCRKGNAGDTENTGPRKK